MGFVVNNNDHGFKTVDGQFTSGMKKPNGDKSLKGYYVKFQFEKIDKDGDG